MVLVGDPGSGPNTQTTRPAEGERTGVINPLRPGYAVIVCPVSDY